MSSYIIVAGDDSGRLVAINIDRVAAVVPIPVEKYRVDMVKSLPILLSKESGLTIIESLRVRRKAK